MSHLQRAGSVPSSLPDGITEDMLHGFYSDADEGDIPERSLLDSNHMKFVDFHIPEELMEGDRSACGGG